MASDPQRLTFCGGTSMATSDAYMELSDPSVWGETYDDQFGMGKDGRKLGAFEITNFTFGVSGDDADEKKAAATSTGTGSNAKVAKGIKEHVKQSFTIAKYIDKGSPDLFLACCKKNKIAWCIISIRETGEVNRKPYLVLEFRNLQVVKFDWNLNPGEPESAGMETVGFDYETVLIKYSRQDVSGAHRVVKMKGWNFANHDVPVMELDAELQAENQATQSDQ
jgi:type VI secretion system Hcp family effector